MANLSNDTASYEFHMVFGGAGFIAFGIPSGFLNLFIAASIAKYTALSHRKEFIILMGLALADGLNMVCYVAVGMQRLYVTLQGRHNQLYDNFHCLLYPHNWLWSFAVPVSGLMLMAVSIDRLLLVTLRHVYITKFGRKYAWGVVGGIFGSNIFAALAVIALALLYGPTTPDVNALCYHPWMYGSIYKISSVWQQYTMFGNSVFPFMSVVISACILPVHFYKENKVAPDTSAAMKTKLKFQNKLTRSIGISCLCTFLLSCIPGRLGYVFMTPEWRNMLLSRMCWCTVQCNPLANFVIFYCRIKDMRTAMHGLLTCKTLPQNLDLWPDKAPGDKKSKSRSSRGTGASKP